MNTINKVMLSPGQQMTALLTQDVATAYTVPADATLSLVCVGQQNITLDCHLTGENARFEIVCVYLADSKIHPDINITVHHEADKTTSDQMIRGVLADKAKACFTGTIHVPYGLHTIEGHQKHQALMLSDTAVVKATPQLFVNSEDAACSHGNTVGFLDQDALFYMQARGLTPSVAKQLLIRGFLSQDLPPTAVDLIEKWTEKNV